jgi:heme A synthase
VATVLATVGLLALGAVVTTFRVGMADPIWPTAPWALLLIDWQEPSPGFLIEHAHRLAGYLVGCCSIVLMVGLLLQGRTNVLRGLGVAALLAVIVQGLLGGFRVRLHALMGVPFSVVHGCFAQVVFSLLVVIALATAGRTLALPTALAPRLRRLTLLLTAVVLAQLVWGALVRHTGTPLAQRMHLLTAFLVVAVSAWLGRAVWEQEAARRVLGWPLGVLAILLTLQVMLGIEAWLGRFVNVLLPDLQPVTMPQAAVRVAHVLLGSWILATAVVLAVRSAAPGLARDCVEDAPYESGITVSAQPVKGSA